MVSSHAIIPSIHRTVKTGVAKTGKPAQGPPRLRPLKQAASGATHALALGYVVARRHPSEPQDQLRGHHIAGGNGAALGTAMRPDGQRRADFHAAQAMLACSGRVQFHDSPSSLWPCRDVELFHGPAETGPPPRCAPATGLRQCLRPSCRQRSCAVALAILHLPPPSPIPQQWLAKTVSCQTWPLLLRMPRP